MIQRNDLLPQVLDKFNAVGAGDEPIKLFGIRNPNNMGKDVFGDNWQEPDAGDDLLGYCVNNQDVYISVGTTRPGLQAYAEYPKDGAGYMAVGFQKGIWVIDIHAKNIPSFAHEALCQRSERGCGTIAFWRDPNKEYAQNNNPIQYSKECCMNMHRCNVSSDAQTISIFGAACQVRNHHLDHETMMNQIKETEAVKATFSNGKYSYLFSYLLTETPDWQGL